MNTDQRLADVLADNRRLRKLAAEMLDDLREISHAMSFDSREGKTLVEQVAEYEKVLKGEGAV